VQAEQAGYTTRFGIFHNDGTKLAVVKGARIFPTQEGKKAKIEMRYLQNMTICEVEGRPILELRRDKAAALKGWAELYAPEGVLIKANDSGIAGLLRSGDSLPVLNVGPVALRNLLFDGFEIAIYVTHTNIGLGHGPPGTGRISMGDGSQISLGQGAHIGFGGAPPGAMRYIKQTEGSKR
jgi:hypothetical protein